MTCIEMIEYNKGVVAISDSRGSIYGREFDIYNKLIKGDNYVIGGSGRLPNILEVYDTFNEKEKKDFNSALDRLKISVRKVYREKINSALFEKFGLNLDSITKENDFLSKYGQDVERFAYDFSRFLFGGYNEKKERPEIWEVLAPSISNKQVYFGVIGSGMDTAQPVLYEYYESMTKEEIKNISLEDALYIGLVGLIAASKSIGVGGRPQIIIVDKNKSVELTDKQSTLLYNITLKAKSNKIPEKSTKEMYNDILSGNFDSALEIFNKEDFTRYVLS